MVEILIYTPSKKIGGQLKNKLTVQISREKNKLTDDVDEYFIQLTSDLSLQPSKPKAPLLNIGKVTWQFKLNPDVGLQLEAVAMDSGTSMHDTLNLKSYVLTGHVEDAQLEGNIGRPVVHDEKILTRAKLGACENLSLQEVKEKEWLIPSNSTWEQLWLDSYRTGDDESKPTGLLINGQAFGFSPEYQLAVKDIESLDQNPEFQGVQKTAQRDAKTSVIKIAALQAFIHRVFTKHRMYAAAAGNALPVDIKSAFEFISAAYTQDLPGINVRALQSGVCAAMGFSADDSMQLSVQPKSHTSNLFLGVDGQIYYEHLYDGIVIRDASGARGWVNDQIEMPGQLYSLFIPTSAGFELLLSKPTNHIVSELFLGTRKANLNLPLDERIRQFTNFQTELDAMPSEEVFILSKKLESASNSGSSSPRTAFLSDSIDTPDYDYVSDETAPVITAAQPSSEVQMPAPNVATPVPGRESILKLVQQQELARQSLVLVSKKPVPSKQENFFKRNLDILLTLGLFILLAGGAVGAGVLTLGIGPLALLIAAGIAELFVGVTLSAPVALVLAGAAVFLAELLLAGPFLMAAERISKKSIAEEPAKIEEQPRTESSAEPAKIEEVAEQPRTESSTLVIETIRGKAPQPSAPAQPEPERILYSSSDSSRSALTSSFSGSRSDSFDDLDEPTRAKIAPAPAAPKSQPPSLLVEEKKKDWLAAPHRNTAPRIAMGSREKKSEVVAPGNRRRLGPTDNSQ